MTMFVNVLAQLPNLRTLELLHVTHRGPITRALKRKSTKFPSIREISVCKYCTDFVKACPNLESVNYRDGFWDVSPGGSLDFCGAGLKRIEGVMTYNSLAVEGELSEVPSGPK